MMIMTIVMLMYMAVMVKMMVMVIVVVAMIVVVMILLESFHHTISHFLLENAIPLSVLSLTKKSGSAVAELFL